MPSFPSLHGRRSLLLMLLVSSIGCSLLRAQDITVSDPAWLTSDSIPDVLPVPKRRLKPDYPDEMRKADETGYVIVDCAVDQTGQSRSLSANGTHISFQRAVETELNSWKMSPALRGGQPVGAWIWVSVIFNPKSAGRAAPDRSPRLLTVTPVFTPEKPTLGGLPPIVSMRLSVDSNGAITQAEPVSNVEGKKTLETIQAALKNWRFTPALKAGKPVAAEITIPVLCQQPISIMPSEASFPKVIDQERPEYPVAMERYGIDGQVTIEFDVNTEGRPENPVIVASDNPAFDEPALEALWKWKFEPAMRAGQKTVSRARQAIKFGAPGGAGRTAFEINVRAKQSKLPPELRYDVSPKILGVRIPVYPYAQRRDDVRGNAVATMLIDPQGAVAAVKVQSADRPEFGLALAAALENFTFDPALKDGKPVPHVLSFEQKFDPIELPDREASWLLDMEKKHPEKIVRATMLDAPIKLVSRKEPLFPRSLGEKVATGDAVIECLIDEKGRVRLPRIVKASEPAFGYAAVQAITAWWFEPPRKAGKPAITRVQVPFIFGH